MQICFPLSLTQKTQFSQNCDLRNVSLSTAVFMRFFLLEGTPVFRVAERASDSKKERKVVCEKEIRKRGDGRIETSATQGGKEVNDTIYDVVAKKNVDRRFVKTLKERKPRCHIQVVRVNFFVETTFYVVVDSIEELDKDRHLS